MNSGRTIFAQIMDFPAHVRIPAVRRTISGNYKIKSFSCWDQFLCMAFAQLTYRESLEISRPVCVLQNKRLYHMGIRGKSPEYAGQCQPDKRLAHLRRLCQVSFIKPEHSMPTIHLASNWTKPSMLWMPRPSIFACRCFHGQIPQAQRRRETAHASRSARQHSNVLLLPTGKFTMSISSTSCR